MLGQRIASLVLRRLASAVVVLLVVSLGVFSLLNLAPGSTIRSLLGTNEATPQMIAALTRQYHLDDPYFVQFGRWLLNVLKGDLGQSVSTLQPVTTMISQDVGVTAFLIIYAFLVTLVIGLVLGTIAARRPGGLVDRAIVTIALAGTGTPAFALAVLMLVIFGIQFKIFPVFTTEGGFLGSLAGLTLPALSLGFSGSALLIKVTRAGLVKAEGQDHVTFARARGLGETRILLVYKLRSASIDIITSSGLILAYLITGDILVERAFSIPGLGTLLVQAVEVKDYPVVQGLTLVIAVAIILVNTLTDIGYLLANARVGRGGRIS